MADEERRLVEAAGRGEVESFNTLVRLYEGRVYNLCYRMLGDADSAADAAQDAFLSAFRNLLHHHVHQSGAGPVSTFWAGLGAICSSALLNCRSAPVSDYSDVRAIARALGEVKAQSEAWVWVDPPHGEVPEDGGEGEARLQEASVARASPESSALAMKPRAPQSAKRGG